MYREISQNRRKRGGVPCHNLTSRAISRVASLCFVVTQPRASATIPHISYRLKVLALAGGSLGSFLWNPSEEWNCTGMKGSCQHPCPEARSA